MISDNRHIYFLGIGGIGMSALARYYQHLGYSVSGYDLTASPLTRQLQTEGMAIHYTEDISKIPPNAEMVVYTPAIPSNNAELIYCREHHLPLIKRAALLGKISSEYNTVAIAGTHGKTSISALTAHLLKHAKKMTTAFVGGITRNYHSNLILSDTTDIFVVEADEFDRSFLLLHPNIGVISSMDADHLDIYENHQALKNAFVDFANQIEPGGVLVHHAKLTANFAGTARRISYGINPDADFRATNIHVNEHKFVFDIEHKNLNINNISLQVPGIHYIENALAAAAVAMLLGLTGEEIKSGLTSFLGVERRFDIRVNTPSMVYIDDYAHHPEEIRVTIEAVRMLYPGKKILGIFQPHLYSRTRDFATGFAQVLETLDSVALLEIYPARELPLPNISSEGVLKLMDNKNKFLVKKSRLMHFIKQQDFDILLTMGAGDIGQLVEEIEKTVTPC